MENVKAIKAILRAFELASGQKINFAKSSCRAFGVSDQWTYGASKYLNCSLMSFPFTYLGIPIGANPRRCQTWEPIITKWFLNRWSTNWSGYKGIFYEVGHPSKTRLRGSDGIRCVCQRKKED